MKARTIDFLFFGSITLLLAAFVSMWVLPVYQYRHEWQVRHQQLLDFQSAIKPVLQSDPKFQFVYCGQYTGGRRGCLGGFVDSTNDLERMQVIYSMMISNHPARVEFRVKIDKHILN